MLWMALRSNLGNTLPIAAFCLLTIITIGEAWPTSPAGPLPTSQDELFANSGAPGGLRQPAAAVVLSAN